MTNEENVDETTVVATPVAEGETPAVVEAPVAEDEATEDTAEAA